MPWQCRLREAPGKDQPPVKTGDMWLLDKVFDDPDIKRFNLDHVLSNEYKRDWLGKRPPICVCLPDSSWFNVDSRYTDGQGDGWTVTGEAPNITASPSINAVGRYHGWLQNGVLSDDVEGRTFPEAAA